MSTKQASWLGVGASVVVVAFAFLVASFFPSTLPAQQQNFATPASLNVAPNPNNPGVLSTGSITPTATAAAIGIATQNFAVTGVTATDQLALISQPAPTALCPPTAARATGTNQIGLDFAVLTAAACTPAAGTYKVLVIR